MGIFSPCCVAQEIFIFTLKYEKKKKGKETEAEQPSIKTKEMFQIKKSLKY